MADANRLRNEAPQVDDDPFAELTRIMGFDPRVPVKVDRAAAPQASTSAAHVEEEMDFSIDLEQELMGALAEPEPMPVANEQQASAAHIEYETWAYQPVTKDWPPQSTSEDEAHQPSLDEEAYAPSLGEQAYPTSEYSSQENDAPHQMDAQVPAAAAGGAAVDEAEYAARPGENYAPADETGPEFYSRSIEEFDVSEALSSDLDDSPVSSFETELADDDLDWLADADPEQAGATAPVLRQGDEFAGSFDAALAEVDMDFSKSSVEADWQSAEEEVTDEEVLPEPDASAAEDPPSTPVDGPQEHDFHEVSDAGADDAVVAAAQPMTAETAPHLEGELAERSSQSEIDDAIAELAAMVRGYDRPVVAAPVQAVVSAEASETERDNVFPEIDTVDVPENAIALADDLDIPEFHEEAEPAPMFDDLDAELAAAFGEPSLEPTQPARAETQKMPEFDLNAGYDRGVHGGVVPAAASFASAVSAMAFDRPAQARTGDDLQIVRREQGRSEAPPYSDSFDVEPDPEDDPDFAGMPAAPAPRPSRCGLIVASVIGGVAVLGVVGALALTGGNGIGTDTPAVVRADADPIKVKPENPGGATVANQESGVFDRAAGDTAAQPDQQLLVTNEEEPVDVASRFPEETPEPIDKSADIEGLEFAAPKGDDRIDQTAAEGSPAGDESVAVQPRKVRTMVVKPDGSLVPREERAPAGAQADIVGSTTAADALTAPSVSTAKPAEPATDGPAAGQGEATEAQAEAASLAATDASEPTAPAATQTAVPDTMPALPSRPAEQPVDIVGEVKPDQVASVAPTATAAGSWSMQIASQPSEAAAKSTYADLAQRYGSVLGGRAANIVKADIAGKGTFWRVRVPAGSRNEAVSLCESYKSAGGNCFVSK